MGMAVLKGKPSSKPQARVQRKPTLGVVPPVPVSEVAAEAIAWREIERKLHRPQSRSLHTVTTPADGIARNYGQLVALFTERRHELGIAQETLDDLAGLPDRYIAKLERPEADAGRSAVHMSFDLWLGALKLGLRVVPL